LAGGRIPDLQLRVRAHLEVPIGATRRVAPWLASDRRLRRLALKRIEEIARAAKVEEEGVKLS
jgi:hypothetical protein